MTKTSDWVIRAWGGFPPWLRKDPGMMPVKMVGHSVNAVPNEIAKAGYFGIVSCGGGIASLDAINEQGGMDIRLILCGLMATIERQNEEIAILEKKEKAAYHRGRNT